MESGKDDAVHRRESDSMPKLWKTQLYRYSSVQPDVQDFPGCYRRDAKNTVYLRPETAQGIFVNFKNVQRTSRKKIPFGIGQIGKSFQKRNYTW